jgi:hypothetical protein
VIETLPPAEMDELRAWFAARGRAIETVETPRTRLDRIFLERVGRGGPAGGPPPS